MDAPDPYHPMGWSLATQNAMNAARQRQRQDQARRQRLRNVFRGVRDRIAAARFAHTVNPQAAAQRSLNYAMYHGTTDAAIAELRRQTLRDTFRGRNVAAGLRRREMFGRW